MEIRKVKKQQIKLIFEIVKKIGIETFNFDTKSKESVGLKIAKVIVDKYSDVEKTLDELILSITDLTNEQLQEMEVDEFVKLITEVWKKNNIMGFFKSAN